MNDCKYAGDICDAYTGGSGQATGGYLAAALATVNALDADSNNTRPPPGTQYPTCWPGHARSHSAADADCKVSLFPPQTHTHTHTDRSPPR